MINKELKIKINNKVSELLELTSELNNDEKREFIEELEDLLDIEEEEEEEEV